MRAPLLTVVVAGAVAVGACGRRSPSPASDTGETALLAWQSFHVPDPDRIPSEGLRNPGTPWGDYLGSAACADCHEGIYERWRGSFHSRTLYEATQETVFGDFGGTAFFDLLQYPFLAAPFSEVDEETGRQRFYMQIRWRTPEEGWPAARRREADTYGGGLPDFEAGTYEILYAFGNRRHQPYVARWPDGRHWVVPVFWNDVEREWRYDGFRPYVESCGGCHVTGIRTSPSPLYPGQRAIAHTWPPRYNLRPGEEGWAEGAVGCENCHGPGREHVDAVERVGTEAYRRLRAEGAKPPSIFDGASASLTHRTDLCGQCHNFFTESTITWSPSPEGFDRDPIRDPIRHQPGTGEWQFYADGSHKSPCTVVEVYRTSKMYAEGIDCSRCHDPHGTEHWADLRLPIERNELCLSCHEKDFPDLAAQTAHSRHAADSPGNRCVECHMPRHMVFTNGVEMMSDRIFSHAFSIPTGYRARGGPPSSCNICHVDRDHLWTRERLREWREDER